MPAVFHHVRLFPLERNILDRVGPEDDQIAEILIELIDGPRVPAIGRCPIADLVTADFAIGCQLDGKIGRQPDGAVPPLERTQQLADTKHHAARVATCNEHAIGLTAAGSHDANAKPLCLAVPHVPTRNLILPTRRRGPRRKGDHRCFAHGPPVSD